MNNDFFKKAVVLCVLIGLTMVPVVNASVVSDVFDGEKECASETVDSETVEVVLYQDGNDGRLEKHLIEMSLNDEKQLIEKLQNVRYEDDSFEDICHKYLDVLDEADLLPDDFSLDDMLEELEESKFRDHRLPFRLGRSNVIDNTRCGIIFAGPGIGVTLGTHNLVPVKLGIDIVSVWLGMFFVATFGDRGFQYTETLDVLLGGTLLSGLFLWAFPWKTGGTYTLFVVGVGIAQQTIWYPFF